MDIKKIFISVFAIIALSSCGNTGDEGEVKITLKPTSSGLVNYNGGRSSCADYNDFYTQVAAGSTDATLGESLDGFYFSFTSLKLEYTAYQKYDILSSTLFIDIDDKRVGGKIRCDLVPEAEAFFNSNVFYAGNSLISESSSVDFVAADGDLTDDGIMQSTSACKIYCPQSISVSESMRGKQFQFVGRLIFDMTVQKKNSDEPPTHVNAQESITVDAYVP